VPALAITAKDESGGQIVSSLLGRSGLESVADCLPDESATKEETILSRFTSCVKMASAAQLKLCLPILSRLKLNFHDGITSNTLSCQERASLPGSNSSASKRNASDSRPRLQDGSSRG